VLPKNPQIPKEVQALLRNPFLTDKKSPSQSSGDSNPFSIKEDKEKPENPPAIV
jgi:hypothetical protein